MGVKKIYPLETFKVKEIKSIKSNKHYIFFTKPEIKYMQEIIDIVNTSDKTTSYLNNYDLVFIPRRNINCKEYLEKNYMYQRLKPIKDLNFNLIPLDKDLLSLEMDHCFKKMNVEMELNT